MPAHLIQMNTPSDHEAQRGCDTALQSAQILFSGSRSNPTRAFFTCGEVDIAYKCQPTASISADVPVVLVFVDLAFSLPSLFQSAKV